MKNDDFSYYLTSFLKKYLPGEKGVSENTILSYRDTFILFLNFLRIAKIFLQKVLLWNLSQKILLLIF